MGKIGRAILELLVDKKDLDKGLGESVKSVLNFEGIVKGVGKTIATAFAVTAIVGAATSVVNLAGDMTDLGAKTGIGVEALQELKYAGSQVGVELETVTGGVNQLQKRLAGGDASAVGAIKALGLNFDELRNKAPEDQFEEIAKKVAAVEDPADRVKLAMDLFGKSGVEMLPLLSDEFTGLMDRASDLGIVMDEETVAAMDTLGDTVGDLMNVGMALIGKVLAPFIPLLQTAAEAAMWLADILGDSLGWAVDKLGDGLKWVGQQAVSLLQSMVSMGQGVASLFPTLSEQLGITQGLASASGWLESAERALSAEQDKGVSVKKNATAAQNRLNLEYAESKPKLTDAQKEQQKYNEELRKMADTLTGKALAEEVKKLADGYALASKEGGITAFESERLGKQLAELVKQGAKLPPELGAIEARFHRMNVEGLPLVSTLESLESVLGRVKGVALSVPPVLKLPQVSLKDIRLKDDGGFAASFQAWVDGLPVGKIVEPAGNRAGKAILSGLSSGLSTVTDAVLGALQGGGNAFQAAAAALGSKIGAGIGGSIGNYFGGPAGKLIGEKIGAFVGSLTSKLFNSNDTKKDREAAAKTMGFSSLDALYRELRSLGAEGAQLVHEGLNVIGKKDSAANEAWIASVKELIALQGVAATIAVPEGAAGFPTKAQLDKAAADAKAAYDYMRESGLYTSDVLQQGWDKWQEALVAAGDTGAMAFKEMRAEMDALKSEHEKLFADVAAELPEYDELGNRIYGVIEMQNIERLKAIEAEQAALEAKMAAEQESAETQMESAGAKQLAVAKTVREGMAELFSAPFRVKFEYDLPSVNGSEGALVGLGAGMTGQTITINNTTNLDGRVVSRNQVQHMGESLEYAGY